MNRLKRWYYSYQIGRLGLKGIRILRRISRYSESKFYHTKALKFSKRLDKIEKKLFYYQAKLENKTEDQLRREIEVITQNLIDDTPKKPKKKRIRKRVKK